MYGFSGTGDADSCELSDMVMGIKEGPSPSMHAVTAEPSPIRPQNRGEC